MFCLFVAISVWKPVVAAFCVAGVWVGRDPARINLMFWGECIVVSYRNSVDIYCTSQSQSLPYVLEYMTQIRISPYIAIRTRNKSATFILTNWGKKH